MYMYYSIGNNSGPRSLVCIVEVSVIGGVRFRRFHCIYVCMYVCMYVCTAVVALNALVPHQ